MRHVGQEPCPHTVGDLAHLREIDHPGDRRATGNQHRRLVLGGKGRDLIVVDFEVALADAVLNRVEPLARLVGLCAVGQVPARVERHAEDRITGLDQRLEHALVRLAAGVGLNVGEAAAEELLRPLDGQRLGHVHILAAAIVTPSGIAFGILVRHDGALGLHHRLRDDVLRRNQLDLVALAAEFLLDGSKNFRVTGRKGFGEEPAGTVCNVHESVLRGISAGT